MGFTFDAAEVARIARAVKAYEAGQLDRSKLPRQRPQQQDPSGLVVIITEEFGIAYGGYGTAEVCEYSADDSDWLTTGYEIDVYNVGDFPLNADDIRLAVLDWQSGVWVAVPAPAQMIRFELTEDWEPTRTLSANSLDADLETVDEIEVYDAYAMFSSATTGQKGYAQWMPDARRYEIIQLEC